MLTIEVSKRPTINQILRIPLISVRIKKFLEQDTFKDEFSHTILHRKQVVLGNPDNFSKPVTPWQVTPVKVKDVIMPPQKAPLSSRYGSGEKPVTPSPIDYAKKYQAELKEKQDKLDSDKKDKDFKHQ